MTTSAGTEDEALLIAQHWNYGGRVHEELADLLQDALTQGSNLVRGHALFIRLYQEQIAALEDFGAWAWALRERHGNGFLQAYLRYQVHDLRAFWKIVREHEGNLIELLRLPDATRIQSVLDGLPRTENTLDEILEMRLTNLKRAADQFFTEDELVVRVYNKLKHGIPIIRRDQSDHRRFEVLIYQRGVQSARFTINADEIQKQQRNTQAYSNDLRDLASLTKILFDGGILYEGAEQGKPTR